MSTRRPVRAVALAAVLAAGLTACGQDGPDRGRVLGAEERSVSLAVGERFTIAVRDNTSAGDRWSVVDPKPDAAVAAAVDEKLELPEESKTSDGVGGTRFYTFEAKGRGTTAVTLLNCFRGYCNLPTPSDENRKPVVRNTYTVTVR
ncbi:protease inhibitor I42 family protein [Kitasatospora sp. NPDC057542]|uniref:protease inhibitor I42 family protein n=1 Tax=Streptomycetaceae TaxID=2062 RepID=UPI001CCD79D3|nr:protease inhibitor I42 family protein [Streptomyces sp. LS1784]